MSAIGLMRIKIAGDNMKKVIAVVLLVILVLSIVGCQKIVYIEVTPQPTETPTIAPTNTPTPTATITPVPKESASEPTATTTVEAYAPVLTSDQWDIVFALVTASLLDNELCKECVIHFSEDGTAILISILLDSEVGESKLKEASPGMIEATMQFIHTMAKVYDPNIPDGIDGVSFGGIYSTYAVSAGIADSAGNVQYLNLLPGSVKWLMW